MLCVHAVQDHLEHQIIKTQCQCIWDSKSLLKAIHLRTFARLCIDLVCGGGVRVLICSCASANEKTNTTTKCYIESSAVASSQISLNGLATGQQLAKR